MVDFIGSSLSEKNIPISPKAEAPSIESAIEWRRTSPSEWASISYSHLRKYPPINIPFPDLYVWRSKPVPVLVTNLFKSSRSSLCVILIFEDLPWILEIIQMFYRPLAKHKNQNYLK